MFQEIQRTEQTSIVLRNLTSHTRFTFSLYTHNEASLSNLGHNVGLQPNCKDISDSNTFTKDGCKF